MVKDKLHVRQVPQHGRRRRLDLPGRRLNWEPVIRRNYGPSGYDRTHMFTAGWNYELPVGNGKKLAISNKVADFLVGGWKISGIFVAYSGTPFTVTGSGSSLQATGNSQTADQIAPVVKLGGKGPNNPYYDPMSFLDPLIAFTASGNTVYRFGSTGRNIAPRTRVLAAQSGHLQELQDQREGQRRVPRRIHELHQHADLGQPERRFRQPAPECRWVAEPVRRGSAIRTSCPSPAPPPAERSASACEWRSKHDVTFSAPTGAESPCLPSTPENARANRRRGVARRRGCGRSCRSRDPRGCRRGVPRARRLCVSRRSSRHC